MGRKLRETVVSAGVIYPAGTDEKDVEGKVTADVWDGDTDSSDGGDTGYAGMKVADLKAEIDKRNEGRDEGDLIEPDEPGNKPELVAALEADDAAQA